MKHFQTHIVILVLFLLAGIISSAGCNKARIPGLVRCEGIVTWKGAPVEGARVAFIPKNQPDGRGAFGITDSGGRFKATTLDTDDGILPGEYIVTVTKRSSSRSGAPPPSMETDPDVSREGRNAPQLDREEMQVTYFLPQVYANRDTSGLSAVISAKGNKDLTFDLIGEISKTSVR